MTSRKADEYERRYPGTGVPEAQAIERMERIERKERGTARRYVTVPELPWRKEQA